MFIMAAIVILLATTVFLLPPSVPGTATSGV